ncbi:hypothetical protein GCK32_000752 [Trichostrongylus colubriformis]|uniref:Uncharacterized protein n=1 Tax=Trichostrongylus colubriformis TaxID=6319 RepID=A0AAN8IWB2_TRICO
MITKTPELESERKYRRLLKGSVRPDSYGTSIFNPLKDVTHPALSSRTLNIPEIKSDAIHSELMPTTTESSAVRPVPSALPDLPTFPSPTSTVLFPGLPQRNTPSLPSSAIQLPFSGMPQGSLPTLSLPSVQDQLNTLMKPHLLPPAFDSFSKQPAANINQEQNQQNHKTSIITSPLYYPFGLQAQLQRIAPPTMQKSTQTYGTSNGTQKQAVQQRKQENQVAIRLEEKAELVEPSMSPTQQQLGSLFQPPPFTDLHSALQIFQSQG